MNFERRGILNFNRNWRYCNGILAGFFCWGDPDEYQRRRRNLTLIGRTVVKRSWGHCIRVKGSPLSGVTEGFNSAINAGNDVLIGRPRERLRHLIGRGCCFSVPDMKNVFTLDTRRSLQLF